MKKIRAFLITILIMMMAARPVMASENTVPEGVRVGETDISGLTREEADTVLSDHIEKIKNTKISLNIEGEEELSFTLSDIGAEVKEGDTLDQAMEIGRSGNVLERYFALKKVKDEGMDLTPEYFFNRDALISLLEAKLPELNREARSSSIEIIDDTPYVQIAETGIAVNVDETVKAVEGALNGKVDAETVSVDIVADITEPEGDTTDFSDITDCLGSYTTVMGYYKENRVGNIINAAKLINGVVVAPGEVFDLNSYLEPYTTDNGYLMATGYGYGGRVVPAMGGGVCQMASTLYNAVLNAELEIVERRNHMMTVSYVPVSMDATVSEGSDNFKFRNNTDTPVYIYTYTSDDLKVTAAIFGKETRPENRTVEYVSVIDSTIGAPADVITVDETKPAGYREVTQGAHTGYTGHLQKNVYVDGELTESTTVNTSRYGAFPRYITVGPEPETEPETEAESQEEPAPAAEEETEAAPEGEEG